MSEWVPRKPSFKARVLKRFRAAVGQSHRLVRTEGPFSRGRLPTLFNDLVNEELH